MTTSTSEILKLILFFCLRNVSMAVHQFEFGLLPRGPLVAKHGSLPTRVELEDFDTAWQLQPACDVKATIDAFISRYTSWSNKIEMWGSENGNRIHVMYEDSKIVGVSCRIAVPQFQIRFVTGVLAVAVQCDWVLVLADDVLAEPEFAILLNAIKDSDAAKFCSNPNTFFKNLSICRDQPE